MPPDEPSQLSQNSLEYETPVPRAWRVVTIPRGLFAFHRMMLENVEVLSIIYGIVVMSVGWLFKLVGIVFVVKPKRPAT